MFHTAGISSSHFVITSYSIHYTKLYDDDQSPIQKYGKQVSDHSEVVAFKDFDHAFAFYAQKRIPVIQTEKELEDYLATHEDVLVLSRDRDLSYMDAIPNLKCIGVDRDLFSRRSTGIYREHK